MTSQLKRIAEAAIRVSNAPALKVNHRSVMYELGEAVRNFELTPKMPRIICLCGSTRFEEDFNYYNHKFSLSGAIVLTVSSFDRSDSGITKGQKLKLDDLHMRKIDLADEIFVINKGGYIGHSTSMEISYATHTGKPINYMEEL